MIESQTASLALIAIDNVLTAIDGGFSPLPDTIKELRLAQSMLRHHGPSAEEMSEAIGSKNWVLHRRTPRITDRYGEDVVCLSSKTYRDAEIIALSKRLDLSPSFIRSHVA